MPTDAAHTSWWQIGEVVFGVPFLAAIVLQRIAPLSFTDSFFTFPLIITGIILCIAGTFLIISTRRIFSKHHQPTDPGLPTNFIIDKGVFSVSRNPMYLGVVCFLVGIALIFKLSWMFIFLVPTLTACHLILILPEERYLAAKFGAEYQRYSASVSRWVGRNRR